MEGGRQGAGTASELERAFRQCAGCSAVAPVGETVTTPAKERNAFTPSHLSALIMRGCQPKLIIYCDVALHIKAPAIVNRVGRRERCGHRLDAVVDVIMWGAW